MNGLRRRALTLLDVALALVSIGCASTSRTGRSEPQWVGSWMAAPQLTEPANLPSAPGLAGRTLRQVVHLSLGGSRLRVRLSNEFGDGDLRVGAMHVARSIGRDAVIPSSDVAASFGGQDSVTIHAGDAVDSDPFDFATEALSDVAVSLYVVTVPTAVTGHPGSRTTSYIIGGDRSAAPSLAGSVAVTHWYLLSRIDVLAPCDSRALVVLGNSIADGRGSGTDRNDRWPDDLARRVAADARTAHVAVLNAGIGGNAVVHGGLGPMALARFERDVLAQPGARWVIVSEGVNDIGTARGADSSAATARHLIGAYRELVARAHARGLRAYGATMLPFGGSFYDTPEHEAARQEVNAWIREGKGFDAVIDFDSAMRDPMVPSRLRAEADGGDHLHPNALGYRMMADAIDLALFRDR